MAPEPRRADRDIARPALGRQSAVLIALLLCGVWAFWYLDLDLGTLIPGAGGAQIAGDFFARALTPAWESEAQYVPPGTPPLLVLALGALSRTLAFAGAAMSLAIVLGLVLGFLGSTAWWTRGGVLARFGYLAVRSLIAAMRSVHELLWALLFLTALGLTEVGAIFAIAIPYAGTLAKIYSELIDEAPRDAAVALRDAGGTGLQVFLLTLVPRALPDMTAYTFYRFECALRSSAVLGFFGYPTVGLYLRQSFLASNYGEVWTFLYALLALILVFEAWSGAVRRRLVA